MFFEVGSGMIFIYGFVSNDFKVVWFIVYC